MKQMWTSLASLMGVMAFLQTIFQFLFPPELRLFSTTLLSRLSRHLSPYSYFDITEMDNGVNTNELYSAVQLYLSASPSVASAASRLSLSRPLNSSSTTFSLSHNDRLLDHFNGVPAVWEHFVTPRHLSSPSFSFRPLPEDKRCFTLRLRKRDRATFLNQYLDHILDRAAEMRRRSQDRLLFTNSRGGSMDSRGHPWESVPFKHPSTFDTLALDPARIEDIKADLKDFAHGKEFYKRTGRAWKRGYLLYGPPGTGKSSMIAAMANFLGYDIYDLELTEVLTNSELRKLLMKTTSKSIIVIEDIDCSINLSSRKKHEAMPAPPPPELRGGVDDSGPPAAARSITLSGLLNFTDGLWSCCGSERIFVFTTNHVEKLDPALLRSGRMDMHIYMSYCSFPALKILMRNYLGVEEGEVMGELEEVVEAAEITPADVSEVLIKNRRGEKGEAMRELLGVLKGRVEEKRRNKNGVERKEVEMEEEEEEEEEEQEKRALESPKEGTGMCNGKVEVKD